MKQNTYIQFRKKLIGVFGKYRVFVADDEAIRNKAEYAEEFGDYGVFPEKGGFSTINFPFIPKNEIWIAESIKPSERHFIIDNALSYVRHVLRGMDASEAYDRALRRETSGRAKDAAYRLRIKKKITFKNLAHKEVLKAVYIREYTSIGDVGDAVRVYLVDGEIVRDIYKTDYIEGGHGYVYEWIPKDEIWIDSKMRPDEIPIILLHEFVERTLMKSRHVPYARAHDAALRVEFRHRGMFRKKDVERLDKKTVFRKFLREVK